MSQQHILQVSELTKKVRFILESELNTVWLTGEISNFISAGSGHWYLSLKDSNSQVKCAMFKGNNRRVRISPSNGQQVLVKARVSLYEPRGDFQLIIEQMEDAGEGLLRQRFEQLKQKLNALGMFSSAHKKDIPAHIRRVGVVTSPTGAAVKDILSVLQRRNPSIEVIIYPALVQGNLAQNDICYAINTANARNECQVMIVGRGGGSLEDLWPFNEESVVQAIYNSNIPIISAVGHEIDTTLSDYAADMRAATPSAAAELVSADTSELSNKVVLLKQRLVKQMSVKLVNQKQDIQHIDHRLTQVQPEHKLQLQQQRFDELSMRLHNGMSRKLSHSTMQPEHLQQRLLQASPLKSILQDTQRLQDKQQRLQTASINLLQHKQDAFVHVIEQLQLVSPLATIARGYSITRNNDNNVIRSVEQVKQGEELIIQVEDGSINAIVSSNKSRKIHEQKKA
ncbi:exodeoxyribonuclease VII large subunit [Colwellia sp. RSH04]|uniref:exodeoxyribonuclease VII large subunit n=1 Tax=Colwellia sp. RSH04 TaxID=2305464 RepID=UPI000E597947|nr:exodeoxyribonuclease VII large subunit [Colwellia sp. RSH04]RHW77697.1 exodeoxyribonuclease VII large subunit [Colwellia sp. RSH04]